MMALDSDRGIRRQGTGWSSDRQVHCPSHVRATGAGKPQANGGNQTLDSLRVLFRSG